MLNKFKFRLILAAAVIFAWHGGILAQNLPQQDSPRPYSDPDRYAQAMTDFAAADQQAPPPTAGIVFVGSSSIRRWNTLTTDMAPLTVLNRGFGGSNMRDAVHHIEQTVLRYKPRAVVLYEGDNDLSSYRATPDMVMAAFEDFYSQLKAALPQTRLYLVSIKPSLSRTEQWPLMVATNEKLATSCAKKSACQFIDVATPMFSADGSLSETLFVSDLLHMTPAGYAIWTQAIKPVLIKNELQFEAAE